MVFSDFQLNPQGLLPVIVQDDETNEVLMLAYMNEESFDRTLKTGKMTYFSRSRRKLWVKGETSGHYQYVRSLTADCDWDTLLARVEQIGAACHTGNRTCFFRPVYNQPGSCIKCKDKAQGVDADEGYGHGKKKKDAVGADQGALP